MFVATATIIRQGTIEVNASAKGQERTYARIRPVQNVEKRLTEMGTFIDMPC
jgi:hypothetical protein